MAKVDIVAAAVTAIQNGEQQLLIDTLGSVFDQGEAIGTGPGFTQADIDNAVKAAVDPLNQQVADLTAKDVADVQAGSDALAALQVKLDDVSKQLSDALTAKQADEQVIGGLQASVASIRALADQLAAIVLPPAP